jgi:hypothetical protein
MTSGPATKIVCAPSIKSFQPEPRSSTRPALLHQFGCHRRWCTRRNRDKGDNQLNSIAQQMAILSATLFSRPQFVLQAHSLHFSSFLLLCLNRAKGLGLIFCTIVCTLWRVDEGGNLGSSTRTILMSIPIQMKLFALTFCRRFRRSL